jgi:uncharacterized protein (DUF1684 family)
MRKIVPSLVLIMFGCVAAAAAETLGLEQWRTKRVANLTSETGWLTLVGLHWLRDGENTFGSDASNRIKLDHASLSPIAGTFELKNRVVTFKAARESKITHDGKPVESIAMAPDSTGNPTVLASGSLRFFVIERGDRFCVRIRDVDHPARKHFAGLEYFPADDSWIVDARFEPYSPERRIPIVNILGMTEHMVSPGAIVFTKDNREWRLDAILEAPDDEELFLMFADATSGRETYGAGRFMYIPKPRDGRITVDFNRAYNPPCAFNEFATCPLPPPQNRLAIRVEAGEKKYRGGH